MKKTFVVMLMAVAMAMPSKAQITFGVTGGVNMTNATTDYEAAIGAAAEAVKSRTDFFFGLTAKFTLPLVGLGVDASALYDQRSGKAGEETIKSQSIQIPVNVRYGIGVGSLASVFLFAGPQFGFNVGGDKDFDNGTEWSLKKSNLSANVGIGATVLSHFQAKVNYNFALGKTGEFEVSSLKDVVGSSKFNCWQISVAYLF